MARGADPFGLFISAIEDDPDFRRDISADGATEEQVRATLAAKEIAVSPEFDEPLVKAIRNITRLKMWSLFENLRLALLEQHGPGEIG